MKMIANDNFVSSLQTWRQTNRFRRLLVYPSPLSGSYHGYKYISGFVLSRSKMYIIDKYTEF